MTPITINNLQISLDGDKFCCLMGANLQEGVAGFGDTIPEAFENFYKALITPHDGTTYH